MKRFKKRKTSKNVKSRQSKPKVYCSAKKSISNSENSKDIFIDMNVEPSPFAVYVVVFVMKNSEPLHLIQFSTDRNSFSNIIDYTKSTYGYRINPKERTHNRLAEILTDWSEPFDDLGTIILNYMACFEAEIGLAAFPEHIGYIMYFDVDDSTNCILDGGAKHDIERFFYDVIGEPLNESLNRETA
jgi:hypothetical protein